MRASALLLLSAALAACDGGTGPVEGWDGFPALLSELDVDAADAHLFVPEWELWTNGATKERRVRLMSGGAIDNAVPGSWQFPDGTRLTKTFSYRTAASPDRPVPVETRVIQKVSGEWQTAVYRWRPDESEADLVPPGDRIPVPITLPDGTAFEHLIPNEQDCQTCHGSRPSFVLGFSELQLAHVTEGRSVSWLEEFEGLGYFAGPVPADPERVTAADARTREVLGYVEGNCTHCHNPTSPLVGLDLTHEVFLENTVGRSAANGLPLIVPGDPEGSFLYDQFAEGRMPNIGVQRLDAETRALLRTWILELEP